MRLIRGGYKLIKRSIEVFDIPAFSQDIYEFGQGSPRIMFTAGIHGDEVTGIYVAERLIEYFAENKPIKGSVKIMPRCNPIATRQLKRKAFYDEIDMNRIFPGSSLGSPTYKAAHNIWKESEGMDIIIDLHCCGQYNLPYILAIHNESKDVKELCMGLNIPRLVKSEGTGGQLFTESCRQRGQKALIIELPSGSSSGVINVEVAIECFDALLNLLRNEGVIAGDYIHNPPITYGSIKDVLSNDNGLWLPQVKKGENIKIGQPIGKINNDEVIAKEDGTILMIMPMSYLYTDDLVATYLVEEK